MTVNSTEDLIKLMVRLAEKPKLQLFASLPVAPFLMTMFNPKINKYIIEGRDGNVDYVITPYATFTNKPGKYFQSVENRKDYRSVGDIVKASSDPLGQYVMVHKDICKEVPLITVANIDGGRIRVPDPKKYNSKFYAPFGGCYSAKHERVPTTGYVVLKAFTEAVAKSRNQGEIREWGRGMDLQFYHSVTTNSTTINNSYVPVCLKNNKGSNEHDYGWQRTYDPEMQRNIKLRFGFGDNEAKIALERFLWFAAGEYPRPRPPATTRNKANEKWQGWLDHKTNKTDDYYVRPMMESLCKTKVRSLTLGGGLNKTICDCLDAARDKELKRIDQRMRVECHSAACVGGGNNVYKVKPKLPCTALQICNQSVNVTANKALLKNITLKCTQTAATPPKNTSSANEDLGSRKVPSWATVKKQNSVKEGGQCDADFNADVKKGGDQKNFNEKIGKEHPTRCSEAAPVCFGYVADKRGARLIWGKCVKPPPSMMSNTVSEGGKCDADFNAMVKKGTTVSILPEHATRCSQAAPVCSGYIFGTSWPQYGKCTKAVKPAPAGNSSGTGSSVTKHSDGSTTTTRTIGEMSWDEPEATTKTFSHQETPTPAANSKPWKPDPTDFPSEAESAPTPAPAEKSTHKTVLGIRLPSKLLGIDITVVLIVAAAILVAALAYAFM